MAALTDRRSLLAAVCGAVLCLLAVLALMAPVLAPEGPFRTGTHLLEPPRWRALMGTDDLGRSVAAGVLFGSRTSLLVAAGVGALTAAVGALIGSLAGYFGGAVDELLMRFAEFTMVLPRFFLAVAVAATFGARVAPLIVLLGLVSWPAPARILRAAVLTQRALPYVEAARALGVGPLRVLLRHVLPNALPPFVVSITLLCGSAILIEASLAFLGLGDAGTPSWGAMLRDAQPLMREAPWTMFFPALAVSVAVLSFNLLGDGLLEMLGYVRPAAVDLRAPSDSPR